MKILLSFLLIVLAGCAAIPGIPGHISESTSKTDNTRQMVLEPAWCGGFKLGLFKSSNMPDTLMILSAYIKGVESVREAAINVDGQYYTLSRLDDFTDHDDIWSFNRFAVSKNLLGDMINGREVWVKITLDNKFVEGEFSSDKPQAARPAFRNFYAKLKDF
jgi:hypothetical protein